MTKTLLSSGLIAGAVAGLVMALLQFWLIQPLIVQAERYETGELVLQVTDAAPSKTTVIAAEEPATVGNEHPDMVAGNSLDVSRNFQTMLFLVLTWGGFGLLASAAVAALPAVGRTQHVSWPGIALIGFALHLHLAYLRNFPACRRLTLKHVRSGGFRLPSPRAQARA
jgi:predicted cobalt transporter CbtA